MCRVVKSLSLFLALILATSNITTFFPLVAAENLGASSDNNLGFDSGILWKTNVTWELSETPARNLRLTEILSKRRIWTSPAVVGDVVYAGATEIVTLNRYGTPSIVWISVYAFNANSGAKIWEYEGNSSDQMTNLAVVDGVIYFGAGLSGGGYFNALGDYVSGEYVYALDASSGKLLWRVDCDTSDSSPAVVQGRVFIGSRDSVIALNAANGHIIWNYTTGASVLTSPVVVNGVVYIGSVDGNVYALNAITGDKIWNHPTGAGVYNAPAVVSGVVYAPSSDRNVYALNAVTGAKLWNYDTTPPDYVSWNTTPTSPSVDNGEVYFVSSFLPFDPSVPPAETPQPIGNGWTWVYALNAARGIKIWNTTIGNSFARPWGNVGLAPVVVDGIVYTRTDRSIFGLNANNGAVIWNYTNIDLAYSSDPVVVNGVLYIGSGDGQIYALGVPFAPPSVVTVIAVVAVVAACAGLLLYFKKRNRH